MQQTPHQGDRKGRTRLALELGFYLTAAAVIALDQVSKYLIRANLELGQSIPEEGLFRLTYITNVGGAFGILGNQGFLITITSLVAIAAVLIYSRYPAFNRMMVRIALGLILGGALGNLIDRLWLGSVVDFIDLGPWPVFNLADSAVVIGVILLIYYILFPARKGEGLSPK